MRTKSKPNKDSVHFEQVPLEAVKQVVAAKATVGNSKGAAQDAKRKTLKS